MENLIRNVIYLISEKNCKEIYIKGKENNIGYEIEGFVKENSVGNKILIHSKWNAIPKGLVIKPLNTTEELVSSLKKHLIKYEIVPNIQIIDNLPENNGDIYKAPKWLTDRLL